MISVKAVRALIYCVIYKCDINEWCEPFDIDKLFSVNCVKWCYRFYDKHQKHVSHLYPGR